MGLGNNSNNGQWLKVKGGKFQLKTGEDTYTEYNSLSGKVTNVAIVDKDYEGDLYKQVNISVADASGRYVFSVRLDSGLGRATLYKLCNANLNEEMEFTPTTEKDKPTIQSMFVKQFGVNIKNKWTKDNPGSMPPLESTSLNGKVYYDSQKQEAYLIDYLNTQVIPKVRENKVESAPQPSYTHVSEEETVSSGADEELPF